MPFRDGGWDADSESQSFAELLFVQWRFADQCGYAPLLHLPPFYRGLFGIADIARRIAFHTDPLAEGLRDLRLIGGLEEFSRMISKPSVSDQLDRYSAMMINLPQNLDEALTLVSESRRLKSQAAGVHKRGRENSAAIIVGQLLSTTS